MFKVLFLKELREIRWIGVLILLVMLYYVAVEVDFGTRAGTGLGYGFRRYSEVNEIHQPPLVNGGFAKSTLLWGCLLSGVLGLWQTFRETQSRTWQFLLYRPVDRDFILWSKLSAAATVFGIVVILPAVGVILWAAVPRAHASPFHWTLTAPVWYALAVSPAIYFAALFAGLRRSHPIGSRWWPLIGIAAAFALFPTSLPHSMAVEIWGLLGLSTTLLVFSVRDELRVADFS